MRSLCRRGLVAPLALLGLVTYATANDYPNRPITIIAPIGAGGPLDITARLLGSKLTESLGKPIIVENRPGGGTLVGAMAVAKADPSGYTLLIAPNSTLTTNVALFKSLPYDPKKDFTPIALLAKVPFVLVGGPALSQRTLPTIIKSAKGEPGKMNYGSTGVGTTPHLAGEILKTMGGFEMTHVAYKSAAASVADVMAGTLQMTFADPANARPLVEAGKLNPIAVSSGERLKLMPEVPTVAESGLPGFEAVAWNMLLAPANTPQPIIEKLYKAVKAAMAEPDVQQKMIAMGLIANPSPSPKELQKYLGDEIVRWSKAVEEAGIAQTQ